MPYRDSNVEQWQTLYVDKMTGSSTDTLVMGGFAVLFDRLAAHLSLGQRIYLRDDGAYYTMRLRRPVTRADLDELARRKPFPLVQALVTAKKVEKAAAKGRNLGVEVTFDYEDAMERRRRYAEMRKALPATLRIPTAVLQYHPELAAIRDSCKVPVELPAYGAFNAFKVGDSINALALAWTALPPGAFAALIEALLHAFSRSPNDLKTLEERLRAIHKEYSLAKTVTATQLQVTNPIAGKGANREKSNGMSVGSLDELWPLALLKIAGYIVLAVPLAVQGVKDRKTYILHPREVEFKGLAAVMNDFREVLWATTAIKLDVLASLRFAQVFLLVKQRRLQAQMEVDDDPLSIINMDAVTDLAQGFDVTLSKDLGSAVATMNMSTIGLPAWLPPVSDSLAVDDALVVLREHLDVMQAIGNRGPTKPSEEGSEEYDLLRHYRDFISARGDLAPFFRFTTAYGPYLLAQRYRKRRVAHLTVPNLEVIVRSSKNDDYVKIINTPGFRTIAACIRAATITPQRRKDEPGGTPYEVRYGLGQELARAAKDDRGFIEALGAFLQAYNAENAREREKLASRYGGAHHIPPHELKRLRRSFRETDLDELIPLIQEHDAALVCSLLLAYGYALGPRDAASRENGEATHGADGVAGASDEGDAAEPAALDRLEGVVATEA